MTSPRWQTFYAEAAEAVEVAAVLRDALSAQGWQPYDPFPGGSGTPPGFKVFSRLFIEPAQGGWVRIIGATDSMGVVPGSDDDHDGNRDGGARSGLPPEALTALSAHWLVLHGWLTGSAGGFDLYHNGQRDPQALSARLSVGHPPPGHTQARTSALPDELEQLARERNVNPEQATRLIDRLSRQLFGKLDRASGGEASGMQHQARALMRSSGPDWNSPAGQRVAALAAQLGLPNGWRDPSFEAVRDAYQAARMLKRRPNATLMDDERAALKAIPNALDYLPVYMGK